MSLHCAARLFVARHGDATYAQPRGILSDAGGHLSELGHEQVEALAGRLAGDRIAGIRTSSMTRAVESGQVAGAALGLAAIPIGGLEEWRVGDYAGLPIADPGPQAVFDAWLSGDLEARMPGAESGHEIVDRFGGALEAIADLHRGESVLVFSHGGVMSFVLPRLCHNVPDDLARDSFVPNAVPALVEVGDAGWSLVSWPGRPTPAAG